jgi:hypothetical protein
MALENSGKRGAEKHKMCRERGLARGDVELDVVQVGPCFLGPSRRRSDGVFVKSNCSRFDFAEMVHNIRAMWSDFCRGSLRRLALSCVIGVKRCC